jgi:hypothetical protein
MTDLSPQCFPKRMLIAAAKAALWRGRIVLMGRGVCSLPQLAAAKVSKSNFRLKLGKFRRHFKGIF